MAKFTERLKHAWNAFTSRDPTIGPTGGFYGSSYRPDRKRSYVTNDGNIITMIENRIAVDVAQVDIRHVKKDDSGNYKEDYDGKSGNLNSILSVSANLDQTGRAFIQDAAMSILDEGCVALVPVDTDINPADGSFSIESIRVGQILEWFPQHIRTKVYNERTGQREEIIVPKSTVAIVENPFYSIMNAPNSTLQRLVRTLRTLDVVNEANASGKMDLIIQLPYSLQSPLKQQQAEARRKQVEMQLVGSKYGIAYIDAAEHITQLNRPVENNLWKEAQDLTAMLYNQLGLTQAIFDGSATADAMTNYYNRTIEPILAAITEEMERKFLTPTARSQHQAIVYIRDPFKLTTVTQIATVAQTFTQNEIMSSNEIRAKIGLPPVDTDRANELLNKNINKVGEEALQTADVSPPEEAEAEDLELDTSSLDDIDAQLDELERMLKE